MYAIITILVLVILAVFSKVICIYSKPEVSFLIRKVFTTIQIVAGISMVFKISPCERLQRFFVLFDSGASQFLLQCVSET